MELPPASGTAYLDYTLTESDLRHFDKVAHDRNCPECKRPILQLVGDRAVVFRKAGDDFVWFVHIECLPPDVRKHLDLLPDPNPSN